MVGHVDRIDEINPVLENIDSVLLVVPFELHYIHPVIVLTFVLTRYNPARSRRSQPKGVLCPTLETGGNMRCESGGLRSSAI